MSIQERLKKARIIPVIAIDQAEEIIPLCEALSEGGLPVAEITFRTQAGQKALKLAKENFPDFLIGAGTVTQFYELEEAVRAGADFAVAPGLNPDIVRRAQVLNFPFFPGVCTPSDIEKALTLDLQLLKFFPAEVFGGVEMIKAFYGPYKHRGISFIPTGGVKLRNLSDYLAQPSVTAVGGTWMVSSKLLKERDYTTVTRLAKEAVRLTKQ